MICMIKIAEEGSAVKNRDYELFIISEKKEIAGKRQIIEAKIRECIEIRTPVKKEKGRGR